MRAILQNLRRQKAEYGSEQAVSPGRVVRARGHRIDRYREGLLQEAV